MHASAAFNVPPLIPRVATRMRELGFQRRNQVYDRLGERLGAVAPAVFQQALPICNGVVVDRASSQAANARNRREQV
jgi:hypothetical protein